MVIKTLIVLVLLLIVLSLASGLVFLVKDKGNSERTVKALTVRIALSVSLFVLLMLGYATGLIVPHGIMPPGTADSAGSVDGGVPPGNPARE